MEDHESQRKLRILCLHGFRTSSEILKQLVLRWPEPVLQKLNFVFLDGQFLAQGRSDVEGIFDPPYYEWFQANEDFTEYTNFEECLVYIEDYMLKNGPFDGLLGFSQGAVLAAALLGLQAQGVALGKVNKIKFLIVISGAKFGGRKYGMPKLAANPYSKQMDCPSLHFIGEKDFAKPDSIALLEAFKDPMRKSSFKTKQLSFLAVFCTIMFIMYRITKYQYHQEEVYPTTSGNLKGLPQGIVHANSDLELKPSWSTSSSRSKAVFSNRNLLAVPVGIKQKHNVDVMVQKKTLQLFYSIMTARLMDGGILTGVAMSYKLLLGIKQSGVEHFSPSRYIEIIKQEGLEISQPALDPHSTEIHHRITIRSITKKFHRRVYERRKRRARCSDSSEEPPCTGFVEGMAPVFSRSAWYCTWHLIQNDLVHGWGLDLKLGYCAQGRRTKKVGVVDSEYVFHKGIQTLGGSGHRMTKIRRQSTREFEIFQERWNQAISEDKTWSRLCVMEDHESQRKVRILCLHGFRTSGEILKQLVLRWPEPVLQKLELVFLDGPFPAQGRSDVEGIFDPPYFEWFQANEEFTEYTNFEECLAYIEDYMLKNGPFDGFLSFSQGAILAAALPGMQAQGVALGKVDKIKFLIEISGAKFGENRFGMPKLASNAFSKPIDCPSLHFIGEKDFMKAESIALLEAFQDPVVIHHPRGHTVPKLDGVKLEVVGERYRKLQLVCFGKDLFCYAMDLIYSAASVQWKGFILLCSGKGIFLLCSCSIL
ncbi:Rhodanese-like domain-containing protein 6 [Glycine max]|nr:Rhodanese-like domain-containing protein 6 [Glycine max]